MSIAVVIAGNGLGVPVKPVDSGAPSMVIAENGLGVPIVISDNGAPFIVDGYDPEPPFAAFSVDAGMDINSGDTGYYSTVYGSISAEPLPDYPLVEFSTRNTNYTQVAFVGDCVSIVAGWKPVIDGVTITSVISDWAFDGSNTSATWGSSGDMAQGQMYAITWIKEN